MSWFARSIANTLSLNEDEKDHDDKQQNNDTSSSSSSPPPPPPQGVKEDLSELTKSLTRQLWGVASFLAPPPESDPTEHDKSNLNESESVGIAGIRSDFAEIRGKLKTGISKISDNIKASEITKMASNILNLGEEDDVSEGFGSKTIGVNDQVVAFAKDISMHPETWLDFPLSENYDDEEFDMSYAQQTHALAVEHLAPSLAALRIELSPTYMSEGQFWKIYFVLLHPRLDKEDALHLSTPQIMEARASLSMELQNRKRAVIDNKSLNPSNVDVLQTTLTLESVPETEKHPIITNEIPVIDKSVTEEKQITQDKVETLTEEKQINQVKDEIVTEEKQINQVKDVTEEKEIKENKGEIVHSGSYNTWETEEDEDDNDDWLKEEDVSEIGGGGGGGASGSGMSIPIENEEDVSFSDLEEDDGDESTSFNKVTSKDSSKDKESNDWLDVDDIDVA